MANENQIPNGIELQGGNILNKGIETISAQAILNPPAITGTVNDYAPIGIGETSFLRLLIGVGGAILTGIQAPAKNQILFIENITGSTLTLSNENALSLLANRFSLGTDIVISAFGSAILFYDLTQLRWICLGRSTSTATNVSVSGQVLFNGVISATINANTNNWNPTGLSTCNTIRVNCNGANSLTGIVAQPEGTVIILTNTNNVNTMTIVNNSLSSAGANRFLMGANILLLPNKSCMIQYDGLNQRWRIITLN